MKRFKQFLAEDITKPKPGDGSSQEDENSEETSSDEYQWKPDTFDPDFEYNPEYERFMRELFPWEKPSDTSEEKPSQEKPNVGPDSLTPEEIEFINNGEPKPSDYSSPEQWRDALERYWRLYFQYFGAYRNSPNFPAQLANDAYDRWLREQQELQWLQNNPPPERQNYSSEEEYQRAFDNWIEAYEAARRQNWA